MSFWAQAMVAANRAVSTPTQAMSVATSGAASEHRVDPHHEEHAGGDHGGGVDEGRHGRGALHGVGQPHVERELGRLARRPEEEEQADGGRRALGRALDGPSSTGT